MGQRTRMGRVKSGGRAVSRTEHREHAEGRAALAEAVRRSAVALGNLPTNNAEGRARFAAKHAAAPWVKYKRTGQGSQAAT